MDPALAIVGILGCLALAWGVWQRLRYDEAAELVERQSRTIDRLNTDWRAQQKLLFDRARTIGRLEAEIVRFEQAEAAKVEQVADNLAKVAKADKPAAPAPKKPAPRKRKPAAAKK